MKFLHLGDIHLCKKFQKRFNEAAAEVIRLVKEQHPDFVILAGDIFNGSVLMEDPIVGQMGLFLRQLAHECPIVGVYGTLSHDIPGILDTYTIMHDPDSFPVFMASAPTTVAVYKDGQKTKMCRPELLKADPIAILSLLPTPGGRADVSNPFTDIRDRWVTKANELFVQAARYKPANTILVGHVSTDFCGPRDGLVIPAEAIPGFDYIALGHEHSAPENTAFPAINYSGSLFHTEANDLTHKHAKVVTIEKDHVNIDKKPLPSKPYAHKIWRLADFPAGFESWAALKDVDLALTLEVPADTAAGIIDDCITRAKGYFTKLTVHVQTMPPNKARMPEILERRTFEDKFRLWASTQIPPVVVTDTLLERVQTMEEIGL